MTESMRAEPNSFLTPILERLTGQPDGIFGQYYEAGEWRACTNAAYLRRVSDYLRRYRALGIGGGDVIFIVIPVGVDTHAAFFAAMLAGAVPSMLPYPNVKQNHDDHWQQHRALFELYGTHNVVTFDALAPEMRERFGDLGLRVIAVSEVSSGPEELLGALPPVEQVALLQHSSGTTGLKKGVALSYEAIAVQLATYQRVVAPEEQATPVFVTWLPLYHDMGLISSFLLPMWLGAPIVSIDSFDWVARPALLLDAIQRFGGTHLWLPNFAFLHLARAVPRKLTWDLGTVQVIVNCSEPCKPGAFDAFLTRYVGSGIRAEMLQSCYAMAETVFAVSQSPLGRPVRRLSVDRACIEVPGSLRLTAFGTDTAMEFVSNGPPIDGCEVAILRGDAFLGEDEVGELCLKAAYMFSGYYKNPDATAATFQDGWYRTGDIGFVHEGELYVVGRVKDLIIVNGKNIFAHDVEAAVSRVPGVKPGRAVAFGHYSDRMGSEQLVVVAERDGTDASEAQLLSAINRAVLGEVGIPCSDVRLVDQGWLAKTTSGKTSRYNNARKYAASYRPVD
ncbi:hypothetical protein E2C06_24300 [Dankookia rubra]|uniref:AMP-dependent synthetase/ligase domain-containing protein n=1 Tax=Dankookia rubra TaxID=1442381 RepID=A0A4R5QBN5_9PROT|nr:AMP-binding protein [Dankookia rubra]TDH59999.1 hypothetical protein E2C06_24300 [Dankookia rubra]